MMNVRADVVSVTDSGHGVVFLEAVQRAIEANCDALLVAKNGISGVFDQDPNRSLDARQYETLNYTDVIR
ncbi:hypothetical protein ACW7EJ_04870, partial [Acinetobacter soli]